MFDNLFNRARLALTLKYVVLIMIISITLSLLFYQRVNVVFDREIERIGSRYLRNLDCPGPNCLLNEPGAGRFKMSAEERLKSRVVLFNQLLWINGVVLVIATFGGFYLSGTTLAPIQKVMEQQKRFIADAAHELRTPLTALKTSLEVNLMDKKLSKKAKRILKENLEDVSSLESLTDSLLKLAKAEEDSYEIKPVNLKQVIDKAIKQIRPLAQKKKIKLQTSFDPEELKKDLKVKGYEPVLIELFVILLDNAVKYSHKNSQVEITIEQRKGQVQVKIIDQGVGIAQHHLKHIFDRFYRVDAARTKSGSGGYGLGLSLAKKIVAAHNGSIKAESELGEGTTLIVNLPGA